LWKSAVELNDKVTETIEVAIELKQKQKSNHGNLLSKIKLKYRMGKVRSNAANKTCALYNNNSVAHLGFIEGGVTLRTRQELSRN